MCIQESASVIWNEELVAVVVANQFNKLLEELPRIHGSEVITEEHIPSLNMTSTSIRCVHHHI